MCRLFGALSTQIEAHPLALTETPKSLAVLSPDHPHGWGIAVHDGRSWSLHKSPTCAGSDARYHELAKVARGRVLIAHVRKATVGRTNVANTHPFRRDGWIFAHNGTLGELDWISRRTSSLRSREIEGDTDSERFFAFLMTALDDAGATLGSRRAPHGAAAAAISRSVMSARQRPKLGSANFLLSDGDVLYAHRFGRTLFTSANATSFRLASEAGHEGAWSEVPEGALLCIRGGARPTCEPLRSGPGAFEVGARAAPVEAWRDAALST